NTQVPKLIGSAERYRYTGQPADLLAAAFFWDRVTQHHSFSSGGHGTDEYFGPPDRLNDRVDGRTCETCNTYNMLKLTRTLFSFQPDVHYADYHERALFNHILASIDPEDGRVCYMVPVGRGVTHEYQDMDHSWTCDVGTGMESPGLHGLGLYYEAGDRLWVNLFAPSTAEWSAAGVRLAMETDFPEGERAKLTLTLRSPKAFTLAMRRPYWVTDGYRVSVNGTIVEQPAPAATDSAAVADCVQAAGHPGNFTTDAGREPDGTGRTRSVKLMSFYRLHRRTYSTYWDLFTPAEWEVEKAAYAAEAERLRRLEAATVAWLQPGETVFERQFNYPAGENGFPQRIMGRPGRFGRTWFSYDLPVEPAHPMTLIATYYSGDRP